MKEILIQEDIIDIIIHNKGIIGFGYIDDEGFPVVEPKILIEVNPEENYIYILQSGEKLFNILKNQKSVSVTIFRWANSLDEAVKEGVGYQLKGTCEVFPKDSSVFKDVVERLNSRKLKPEFLNDFLSKANPKIIGKDFLIKVTFNLKYSVTSSSNSAKPMVKVL